MGTVTESIFSGKTVIIPMAEVQHVERDQRKNFEDGISVIFKSTRWSSEMDVWDNSAFLRHEEAKSFLKAWCTYRSELEAGTLMDLTK